MGLTEFISARLDEDELAANPTVCGCLDANHIPYCVPKPHLERPRREVAAKRAIVTRCARVIEDDAAPDGSARGWSDGWSGLSVARAVLRQLAAAWSNHPDYRREWAPES